MRILKISAQDVGGGAANVAHNLATAFRVEGHECVTVVGTKHGSDDGVIELPDTEHRFGWARAILRARDMARPWLGKIRGMGRVHEALHCIGRPQRLIDRFRGIEDFNLPSSRSILDLAPWPPDVVHAHNLHSLRGALGHFNLQALPALTAALPWILTLHDAWLTTGHCAHSLACDRWITGCGTCPDLDLFPAIYRDETARNWQRKHDVFARTRLYVATPSRWLMERVERSMLAPAMIEGRVIANGIDLSVFHSGDRKRARGILDLPQDRDVILFAAGGRSGQSWKDISLACDAMRRIAASDPARPVSLIVLGDPAPPERRGLTEIQYVGARNDPQWVANYFRAANLYLHAARADTFPTAIIEAMACGNPIVATAVGGIPEQVTSETGILVPQGDSGALANAITTLLGDTDRRRKLGDNAAVRARERFDLQKQAGVYLDWFHEILKSRRMAA